MTKVAATAVAIIAVGADPAAVAAPAPALWQAERVVLHCDVAYPSSAGALVQGFCRKVSEEARRLWGRPVFFVRDAGPLDPLEDLQLEVRARVRDAGGARRSVEFTLRAMRRGFPLDRIAQRRKAELAVAGDAALRREIAASLLELIPAPRQRGSVPSLPKAS